MALIAATGSNLEAEYAGTNPEIIPINADTSIPRIIFELVNENSISIKELAIWEHTYTKKRPVMPPIRLRIIDSNKICKRIK